MGMDLIGTTYVAIVRSEPAPTDEVAKDALRRVLFSLPEEKLDEAADSWSWLDEDDEESDTFSDTLLDRALSGWKDIHSALFDFHRFHVAVASNDEFMVMWAGGGSWGDDPYEDWNDLCIFLWVLYQAPDLVPIFGVDANVPKYLKDLKDVT